MTTFKISEFKKSDFIKKMDKISRKATKLGIDFGYKLVDVTEEFVKGKDGLNLYYTLYHFDVWGESPTINGYEFLAKIEPFEGSNLIHSHFTDIDFSQYRDAELTCEHCKTNRYRKFYFVIRKGDENKMVGQNCLANYINIPNAEKIGEFYSSFVVDMYTFMYSDDDNKEYSERVQRGDYSFPVDHFLAYANFVVSRRGYVSTKNEDTMNGILSTRSRTINEFYYEGRDAYRPTDEDIETAKSMMEVVREHLEGKDYINEYESNILKLISANRMLHNHAGYVVSIVPFYSRIQGESFEKKNNNTSEYIAEVGSKIENVPAVVESYRTLPGYRDGVTHMYTFDASGNKVTYFSTNDLNIEVGQSVVIQKATVKKHSVYNNVKQTQITRGKVF